MLAVLVAGGGIGPDDPGVRVGGGGVQEVEVELAGMRVRPALLTVDEGVHLRLRVVNRDTQPHDLRLDSGPATPMLRTGEEAVLDVGAVAGPMSGWCTVAGHRAAGMSLRIERGAADRQRQGPQERAAKPVHLIGGGTVTTVAHGLDQLRELAGADLGTSGWLAITQDRVDTFADATGDHQWIHVDAARAATGPFGGTIAHGYLTLALVIPLWSEILQVQGVGMALNYGLNRLRFPSPVPVGSRLRLRARVVSVEDVSGGVQLTAEFTVERQGNDKPAAVAEALYRYYPDQP